MVGGKEKKKRKGMKGRRKMREREREKGGEEKTKEPAVHPRVLLGAGGQFATVPQLILIPPRKKLPAGPLP